MMIMAASCQNHRNKPSTVQSPRASPLAQSNAGADGATLAAEAEIRLSKAFVLDYRAPLEPHPGGNDRKAALQLFVDACARGDKPSCWKAESFAAAGWNINRDHKAYVSIGTNCLAGDRMSCRALIGDHFRQSYLFESEEDAGASCKAGLAAACEIAAALAKQQSKKDSERSWLERGCALRDARSCDRLRTFFGSQVSDVLVQQWKQTASAAATAECDLGYAPSCQLLRDYWPSDDNAVKQKMLLLAKQGCEAGLIDECFLLQSSSDEEAAKTYGLSRQCMFNLVMCLSLGAFHLKAHRLPQALEAYELSCQLDGVCTDLAELYLTGALAEPKPNRAISLLEWQCRGGNGLDTACAMLKKYSPRLGR